MAPRNLFHISKLLNFKEKMFVSALLIFVLSAFFVWAGFFYLNFTKAIPKKGGEYAEGIVGQPVYVNPLLSQTSEADADLVRLVYSGLLKYDKEGRIINDLAEGYEVSEDQKTYTVHLKKNAKWHDGEPVTGNDVIFTVRAVQDPAYKSPLRQNWQGAEVEQLDDYTIKFSLKNPYFGFLDSNLTMGIIPKHIWENIAPEKFTLSEYNSHPIGSGPYRLADFQKDSGGNIISCRLAAFPGYFEGEAYISKFNFNFYPDEQALIAAYNKKEIDGMGNIIPDEIGEIKSKSARIYELNMPNYFAVFLNQTKSAALADDKVREALAYGVNRDEIIEKVLHGKGVAVFSPFLPRMKEYEDDISKYEFNAGKAKEILEEDGWKSGSEGAREKNGKKLEFDIFTLDSRDLTETADILKEQWKEIGADARVNVLAVSDLQQNYIRPREYGALLFGQAVSFNPDPYSFWHSSQKRDPGYNLALFDDKKSDELLDKARQELDEGKRIESYREFQKILTKEIPAIFLYSPGFLYPVNQKVKGIEVQNINTPSWRFAEVNKWYVKTKRVRR